MENGVKQYLAYYDDANLAPAWLPEAAIPRVLTQPYNPPQEILSAMPAGEGTIEIYDTGPQPTETKIEIEQAPIKSNSVFEIL